MVSLEVIAILLSGIGISASLVYYANILSNTSKARQKEQIHLRIQSADLPYTRAWTNVMFKKAPTSEEWQEVYHPIKNPELFAEMIFIRVRFQSLGVLLKEKAISPDLLFKIYTPNSIMLTWEHYKINVMTRRIELNEPTHMSEFEYLYNETKRRFPNVIVKKRQIE